MNLIKCLGAEAGSQNFRQPTPSERVAPSAALLIQTGNIIMGKCKQGQYMQLCVCEYDVNGSLWDIPAHKRRKLT